MHSKKLSADSWVLLNNYNIIVICDDEIDFEFVKNGYVFSELL